MIRVAPLKYKADKSVVENWRVAMKTMDEMMQDIDAKKPKVYMPNKFKEMKEYNDTDGKVVVSKMELTPVAQAPEVPSLKVQNLNGSDYDVKNLTGGKLTLLLTCFKNSGFDNLAGWRQAFENALGEDNSMVQIVQLNIIEEWYVRLFPGMIRKGLRTKVPESQYGLTLVYYGECNEFRAAMDMTNTFVGYVQLVDAKGRVRWTAAGNITPEESTVMTLLTSKILAEINVLSTLTNEILRDDLKIWAYGHRVKLLRAIHVVVLPPTNLPEIPKVGRRRFYNSKVGRDIRLNSTYPHRVLSGPKGSCVMCFSDSTSGRRRELTTTKKCLTCQVHLCAKTFGEYTTSCFEAFHEQDTLDMRARPPPRPRVMYILPNWDPAKDSYESLKRENLRMQLQHQS
ncbi:hypothetical protein DYB25_008390 [Aphanomyces astaci]|uniref:Uncharacterized protein n=1 Tax=Aphanomyces astaci TaxID=112090 RepID=A0A397AC47_APHAT|nr:hypothetical protein DYB25_008390 [Aphanomyces astaci]RHY39800.1 hypothetical protein DYB34_008638 [Aphanomyces astaci]RHY56731.1 hypothetical protein DYB38_007318 [Aphanomyces astaci]RHZ01093.1 hypothetical protein DYB31_003125 [Aphanomyces astaci]RHZ32676.1 hypothetical protein DYB26_007611 [Aphanomyces astaci]